MGRCRTGWRNCPKANSAFEEFAIANTERISQIEIIDGPAGLVGYGVAFWHADQQIRDAAYEEHCRARHSWWRVC